MPVVQNNLLVNGSIDGDMHQYLGAYAAGSYLDGDIVVQNGVAYLCVRPTSAAPTAFPTTPALPTVTNGQWLKGSGGAAVWAPLTEAAGLGNKHAVTFQNSWGNYGSGFPPATYWKDAMGIVHLEGLVSLGTINTTIFTLPAGYRPGVLSGSGALMFATTMSGGAAALVCDLRIDSNGNVGQSGATAGQNAWVNLNNIHFDSGSPL